MKIAGVRETKQKLTKYIRTLHSAPIIITKHGRPCAALIELTNETDLESFLCAFNHKLLAMIDRSAANPIEIPFEDVEKQIRTGKHILDSAYRRIQKGGGIKSKDFWKATPQKKPS